MFGQQAERRAKSNKNIMRNPKRQRDRNPSQHPSSQPGQPTLKEWAVNKRKGPSVDEEAIESPQGNQTLYGGDPAPQQMAQGGERRRQPRPRHEDNLGLKAVEAQKEICEQGVLRQPSLDLRGKYQDITNDPVAPEQQPPPKKRQRTILEFTGTVIQDHLSGNEPAKEGNKGEAEAHCHSKDKKMMWLEGQPGPRQKAATGETNPCEGRLLPTLGATTDQ